MKQKVLEILNSSRFWQVFAAIALLCLASYGLMPKELADSIATLLGISVTIRTVDRFAEKSGSVDTK